VSRSLVGGLGSSKGRKKLRAEGSGPNRFRPRRLGLVRFRRANWVQEIGGTRCRFRYPVYVYRRLVMDFKSYQEILISFDDISDGEILREDERDDDGWGESGGGTFLSAGWRMTN
jgi:hypothetical protein